MLKVRIQSQSHGIPYHSRIPLELNLNCAAGELHALVGPSGSGKTTILRTIAGLHQPELGLIECAGETWYEGRIANQAITNYSPAQRSCGFLFQQYALFPHLSALHNVAIALENSGLSKAARLAQSRTWLERMALSEFAERFPGQLSGGQQQRVALARALARNPKVLLLDEPFSAIDNPTRQNLYRILAELRQDLAIPMILVTHDLREANLLADTITVIDQGIGLQTAAPNELFQKPRNSRVAALVGIPNVFNGIFNSGRLDWLANDWHFDVLDKGKIPPASPVAWVIPPEGLTVYSQAAPHYLPAQVEAVSSIGQIAVVRFSVGASKESLVWEASSAEIKRLGIQLGSTVFLELDASKIHIMPLRPINDPRRLLPAH
ncbi:ABC transporter ATP-binding protein [Polynucleobacter sp. IMCC 30228]|uniref:ABC transporter ATP-binding protein n=1 Tax=Polynucleobacter sp. IMCC 30228 TaxID=2781011 RepID=UPI001F15B8D6|nr:ABC transporter ATP-binding protein [Polynucleobacter sp. IMCC 30228]MCE7527226.1 ABC transporter ATP-binding protein [Polynucleobacter sp. IMCC 30228]